jgi:hypothetical protein
MHKEFTSKGVTPPSHLPKVRGLMNNKVTVGEVVAASSRNKGAMPPCISPTLEAAK